MSVNRLNWPPPGFGESGGPATNRRPDTPRPKRNPFPAPADSLNKLSEANKPTEARLLLVAGADVNVFREAFTEVWDKIPGFDRHHLLQYWREDDMIDRYRRRTSIPIPPKPRPNLLLLADSEIAEGDAECRDEGHVLAFRVSLTKRNRERLRPAIATALAQAYGTITKVFGKLLIELYESFDSWADAHQKATKKERDKAWQPLADDYTRAYWQETSAILQRWGFAGLEEASR